MQKRTAKYPKVEVEQAELRVGWGLVGDSIAHTFNFQGYSLLPTQGVFCGVLVGGSVTVGDRIRVLSRQLGSA